MNLILMPSFQFTFPYQIKWQMTYLTQLLLNQQLFKQMSQIEKVGQSKKLFRYAIDRHIQLDQSQRMHFYRLNRWRFNTFNRKNLFKFLKLKWVIPFVFTVAVVRDYTYDFYANPPEHH